ncbi:hypothetical protein CPLU01_08856 [Colletotrichum plurivorum]|uniref:Aminoglycoside phosphotransferase domain-containing protein n=1 Tax=Colletotrichum plurivorum TaxID=2175906 RepID=A0A8H6NBV9_9PEZI|nr:hypothetical protein CPLU01_08856 [Colletotrichum plurivorum]
MADPASHLPPPLTPATLTKFITSLDLPLPTRTEPLTVTAAFHKIYLIHFTASASSSLTPAKPNTDGGVTLVLRLAGPHLPRIKTENEVAMMRWVRENTSVPVPAVIRWDSTTKNPLGCEFTLLERVQGRSADKLIWGMGEEGKKRLVGQVLGFLAQMKEASDRVGWGHVGGLKVDRETGKVVPGPVVDEWFWMEPEVQKFWQGETVESLNPVEKPFKGWAELLEASMGKYVYMIERHDELAWMRDLVPRLEAYRTWLATHPEEMETNLVLAHRDLHLANVMAEEDGTVTGILDWEFGGVVPGPRWDPPNAFLYPWGEDGDTAKRERETMRGWAKEMCQERGIGMEVVNGVGYRGKQESAQRVGNFTRAICEVCPWGEKEKDKAVGWRGSLEEELGKLGL